MEAWCPLDSLWSRLPPGRVTVASIAGLDETVIATIHRHVEPVAQQRFRAVTVISFEGDVDRDTAPYLDRALHRAVSGGTPVCCDLGRVGFFGAAGARVVLSAVRHSRAVGGTFLLRGVPTISLRVLEVAGVDHSLIIG